MWKRLSIRFPVLAWLPARQAKVIELGNSLTIDLVDWTLEVNELGIVL